MGEQKKNTRSENKMIKFVNLKNYNFWSTFFLLQESRRRFDRKKQMNEPEEETESKEREHSDSKDLKMTETGNHGLNEQAPVMIGNLL